MAFRKAYRAAYRGQSRGANVRAIKSAVSSGVRRAMNYKGRGKKIFGLPMPAVLVAAAAALWFFVPSVKPMVMGLFGKKDA